MHAKLKRADDFEEWRLHARSMLNARVEPGLDHWSLVDSTVQTLFDRDDSAINSATASDQCHGKPIRVARVFLDVAKRAVLHRDEHRFSLMYRVLWRLQSTPDLMSVVTDPDIRRLSTLAHNVGRDIHKMRAFLRFRPVRNEIGEERFIAWFEPDHHILRVNARFFVDRFASQSWSIFTPDGSLHWDGQRLTEGPAGEVADERCSDGVQADELQGLWHRYYAATFNPARLKVSAMTNEMPRKYWKNLPETQLIPQLIAGAQAREAAMVSAGAGSFPQNFPTSVQEIDMALQQCRRCSIGCNDSRAVAGEGPLNAQLMIVGEQPGDTEEAQGRPFVGPAGRVLNDSLRAAGLDRSIIRMTNAVKHFKFERRDGRRLHKSPTAAEIDTCRWWLEAERHLIRPKVILALGASAGRSLLGRTPSIARERGQPIRLVDDSILWLTVHPAYLLRIQNQTEQEKQHALFLADLMQVKASLQAMSDD